VVADRYDSTAASFPGAHYGYGAFGTLTTVVGNGGDTTSVTPDAFGRTISETSPVGGLRTFHYNQFGELDLATDGNQNHTQLFHDKIGRLTSRTDSGGVTAGPNGVVTQWTWRRDLQNSLVFEYDEFGRPSSATRFIDGEPLVAHVEERDAAGRETVVAYPSQATPPLRIRNIYDASGTLTEVQNADVASVSYWKLQDINNFGQLRAESFGNGLTTTRTYDDAIGRPQSITTGAVQNESYRYHPHGSLEDYNDIANSKDTTGSNGKKSASC
jgi:YD repeat-containing protein